MNTSPSFERELESLVNRYSRESDSDTPDFILAQYIVGCLQAFNIATRSRDTWHGFVPFSSKDGSNA